VPSGTLGRSCSNLEGLFVVDKKERERRELRKHEKRRKRERFERGEEIRPSYPPIAGGKKNKPSSKRKEKAHLALHKRKKKEEIL